MIPRSYLSNSSVQWFRYCLAIFLIVWTFNLWPDTDSFFGQNAILKASMFNHFFDWSFCWSFSEPWQLKGQLILLILCGLSLPFSRWPSFIAWIVVTSFFHRNRYVFNGGDHIFQLLLLLNCFLTPNRSSVANTLYLIQQIIIYSISAILKTGSEWHQEGSAVYYALALDAHHQPLGNLLLAMPSLMSGLTHFVWWPELLAPIVLSFGLLIPKWANKSRWIFISLIASLHIGILLTMYVGLFPLISLIALIPLIPLGRVALEERNNNYLIFKETLAKCLLLVITLHGLWVGFDWPMSYSSTQWLRAFGLYQFWGMFSPYPSKDNGHLKVIQLSVNHSVNVLNPSNQNSRWREYERGLFTPVQHPESIQQFAAFYCRQLPKHPPSTVEIWLYPSTILPNFETAIYPRQLLNRSNCSKATL